MNKPLSRVNTFSMQTGKSKVMIFLENMIFIGTKISIFGIPKFFP